MIELSKVEWNWNYLSKNNIYVLFDCTVGAKKENLFIVSKVMSKDLTLLKRFSLIIKISIIIDYKVLLLPEILL